MGLLTYILLGGIGAAVGVPQWWRTLWWIGLAVGVGVTLLALLGVIGAGGLTAGDKAKLTAWVV